MPKVDNINNQKKTTDEFIDNSHSSNPGGQARNDINIDKVGTDSDNFHSEKSTDNLVSSQSEALYKLGDSKISINHNNYVRSHDDTINPLDVAPQKWHQDDAKTDQQAQHEKVTYQQTKPDFICGKLNDKIEKLTEDNRSLGEVLKENECENQTKGRKIEELMKIIDELKTRLRDEEKARVVSQEVVSACEKMHMTNIEHQLDSEKIIDEWKVFVATKLKEYQNAIKDNVVESLSRHEEKLTSKQESLSKVNEELLVETANQVDVIKNTFKELQIGFGSSKDAMNIIIDSNMNTHGKIVKEIQKLLSSLDDTRMTNQTNIQDVLGCIDKNMNDIIKQNIAEKERLEKEHERLMSLQLFMESERGEMVKMQDHERAKLVEKATLLDIRRKNEEREYDMKFANLENIRKELTLKEEALIASQEKLEENRKTYLTESRKEKVKNFHSLPCKYLHTGN